MRVSIFQLMVLAGVVFLTILIHLRPIDVGTDTVRYLAFYSATVSNESVESSGLVFHLIAKLASFFDNPMLFLTIPAALSMVAYVSYASHLVSVFDNELTSRKPIFIALIVIAAMFSPFFWNGSVNLLKSNLAMPLTFIGTLAILENKKKYAFVFFSLAVLAHITSIVFISSAFVLYRFRRYSVLIIGVLCLGYLLNVPIYVSDMLVRYLGQIVGFFGYASYLNAIPAGLDRAVPRYDFFGFTIFFFGLILSARASKKMTHFWEYTLYVYSAMVIPFLLLGYIPYSDRLLFNAWSFLPIIISGFILTYLKIPRQFAMWSAVTAVLLLPHYWLNVL